MCPDIRRGCFKPKYLNCSCSWLRSCQRAMCKRLCCDKLLQIRDLNRRGSSRRKTVASTAFTLTRVLWLSTQVTGSMRWLHFFLFFFFLQLIIIKKGTEGQKKNSWFKFLTLWDRTFDLASSDSSLARLGSPGLCFFLSIFFSVLLLFPILESFLFGWLGSMLKFWTILNSHQLNDIYLEFMQKRPWLLLLLKVPLHLTGVFAASHHQVMVVEVGVQQDMSSSRTWEEENAVRKYTWTLPLSQAKSCS